MWKWLHKHIHGVYAILAFAYVVVALLFLYVGTKPAKEFFVGHFTFEQLVFVLLGVLLLGPPLWFLTEYNHIYKGVPDPERTWTFEEFKYNQELSSRVWAAVSAIAIAIVLKK